MLNAVVTTYHYDVDADADPTWTHRANRLMYSETRDASFDLLERVEYEYALDGDAAGNVTQVIRGIPLTPAPDPVLFDFFATHFTYNKAGEVRIVTQRHWFSGATSAAVLKIREFRGSGRARHMMRDRDVAWPYAPDYTSAQWTDYNGDLPSADYTVTDCTTGTSLAAVADDTHYSLGMAEIDYCTAGESCTDDAVSYTHTNHLGTTRARTNAASVPFERPVYTAFGERIDGDITSRYGYVGKQGYETMDAQDWGTWDSQPLAFNFIHTGVRWYDPSTGRFLQRDPIGIMGGLNVYEYVTSNPLVLADPSGQLPVWVHKLFIGATGGRDSWLDDERKVAEVQKRARQVGGMATGALLACVAPVGAVYGAFGWAGFRFSGGSAGIEGDQLLDGMALGVAGRTLPRLGGGNGPIYLRVPPGATY